MMARPFVFALVCGLAATRLISLAAPVERLDASFEWVDSDDVTLLQGNALSASQFGKWDTQISLSFSDFSFDYVPVPFDLNGQSGTRSESNIALQINGRKTVSDKLTLMAGGGGYDGYSNYRSAWLDEYYRQQFSDLSGVPGAELYRAAKPKGFNINAGLRWMYLPNSGFAQISISQLQDEIAPGYEIDFEGLRRGETVLATSAVSLSTENVLSKRVRSLFTLRASETSAREPRYGAEYAINAALNDRWTVRALAGGSKENPQFDAHYANLALEFALNETTSVYVDGRYYKDTGEIENSLFTAAAPGVTSRKIGVGIKWVGEQWSGRFYFAPISSSFEETPGNVDFFQNLYQDRDWTVFQLALSKSF